MKTTPLLVSLALAMAALAVVPSASAMDFQGPGGGGPDSCAGIVDVSGCTCKESDAYCDEGNRCSLYTLFTCIIGGDE